MSFKKDKEKRPGSPYVVGIGASAGGLDAINRFFEHVPENSGLSFVIVQHLSPDHKSLMAGLLSKHTSMSVTEVEDGMYLRPDHVYLLPSKKLMTVKAGRLYLSDKEKTGHPHNVIDVFFESLAAECGERAVGIILSGTGSDGSKGVQSISGHGGTVIVQEPSSAAFNGMPASAIATGTADMVLMPENMASDLVDYLKDPQLAKAVNLHQGQGESLLRNILTLIRKVTGYDFSNYKNPTLIRRLSKRMAELNISRVEDYLEQLNQNPAEITTLSSYFLINVTHFFRDKDAFEVIKEKVIPAIFKNKSSEDIIKVWVAACSTGEEAYSLAMLFNEYMEKKGLSDITVKIFATDIDKHALEIASRGVYSRAIMETIPGQYVAKYFDLEAEQYKIKAHIRKMVLFSQHDLLKDPPFGRMSLISCRNMLIYISQAFQKEILKKLHFAMNLDGYLFLGPSEHIDVIGSSLQEIDKKWRIYKCINKAKFFEGDQFAIPIVKRPSANESKNPMMHLGDLFKETILEDGRFAGIFVDTNFDVKQAVGNYKSYIQFPENGFNLNLLKITHADLAVALGGGLRNAIKNNETVILKEVKLNQDKDTRYINIIIKPYLHHSQYQQQFLFITLNEETGVPARASQAPSSHVSEELGRVQELEAEIRETKDNLQAVIEEMEATNEEMQSANEELVSTNEELQSANEELQSLNEELHTVSAEHQAKIKELMELNDDLNNYFRNSEIGQVLVDRHFIVRKFSPSVSRMINLIPSDVNRSITDITTRFKSNDFIGEIGQVMQTGRSFEKEMILDDKAYVMKITPYEKQNKIIDGVVINFIDITNVKRLDSILNAVFKSVPSAILAARAVRNKQREIVEYEFVAANKALEADTGISGKAIIGKELKSAFPKKHAELFEIYKKVTETGEPYSYDYYNSHTQKWSNVVIVKMLDGVVSVSTDITGQKKAAELVQQNYDDLRQSLRLPKRNT